MCLFLLYFVFSQEKNNTQLFSALEDPTYEIKIGYGDNVPVENPLDAQYNHLSFVSLGESLKTIGTRNLTLKKNYPFKIYLTFTQNVVLKSGQILVTNGSLQEEKLENSENIKAKKEFLFTCIPEVNTEEIQINFNGAFSFNRKVINVDSVFVKFDDLVPGLTMDWFHSSNPKNFLAYEASVRVLGPNFTGINQFQENTEEFFCENCQLSFFTMNQIGSPFSTYNFDIYPLDPSHPSFFYLKNGFFKTSSSSSLASLPLNFSWSDRAIALSINDLEKSKIKKENSFYYQSFDLFLNGSSKKSLLDTTLITTPRSIALQTGYSFERKKHEFNIKSKFYMTVNNTYIINDVINLNSLQTSYNNTGLQILSLNKVEDISKHYIGYFSISELFNNDGFFRLRIPFDFFIKNDDPYFLFTQSNNIENKFLTYLDLSIDIKKISDTVFKVYLLTPLRVVKKESFAFNSFFKTYDILNIFLNGDSVEGNDSFFLTFTIQKFNEGISSFVINPKEVIQYLIGDDLNETSFGDYSLVNKQDFINKFLLPTIKIFLDKTNNKFTFNVFYNSSSTLENILSDINYTHDNLIWYDLQL